MVGLRRGRATVVRRNPGDDSRTGRGGRRPLRLDRVPLSQTRLAAASHPSSGRELHRHRGSPDRARGRAALRHRDRRLSHRPHGSPRTRFEWTARRHESWCSAPPPGSNGSCATAGSQQPLPPSPRRHTSPIRRRARSDLSRARADQRRPTPDARRLTLLAQPGTLARPLPPREPTHGPRPATTREQARVTASSRRCRFATGAGVSLRRLDTLAARPTRARRPAHHACSLRHRCRRRLSDTYRRRDVANRVPNGCGVDASRPRPASFSLTARSTSPRIRRGEPSGARSHARSRAGVRPGKGILGRAGCALPLVAEDR